MYHHDSRNYLVATSEAAKAGRDKMEQIIASGRQSAMEVVNQVQEQVPQDFLAKTSSLKVRPVGDDGAFSLEATGIEPARLHAHALGQVCDKAGIPGRYVTALAGKGQWGKDLAAHNFNELFAHGNGHHNLIRRVNTPDGLEVRGFLSDRFRRLDSRPLLDAFIGAVNEYGAVPINGYALDTKVRIRAVLPHVFEPVPNEVMLFGIQWGNSDFGDGGHTLALWNMRVWCTNTAIMDEVLRQVHLGRQLNADEVNYSERTLQLDVETNASAMKDVVREFLSADRVNGYMESIRRAVEEKVDERDVTRLLRARNLGKDEVEKVEGLYKGPDVINLPAGNHMYRLSNAVSWFAQDAAVTRDRQLFLQRAAGELMPELIGSKPREV